MSEIKSLNFIEVDNFLRKNLFAPFILYLPELLASLRNCPFENLKEEVPFNAFNLTFHFWGILKIPFSYIQGVA